MRVTIGVDPHKHSRTAAVLTERGDLVDQQRFATTRGGYRDRRRWAKRWPERRWAVEGASGLGRTLAQQLATDGEPVVDVPAKLAARVRLLSVGHGRKSDAHDAVSVAVAAQGTRRLGQVRVEDHATMLRLLSDRRDDLVRARTQTLNRLHVLLADLVPGGAGRNLDANTAAALLRRVRPQTAPARTRRQLAVDLLADVRALNRRIATTEDRLQVAVTRSATTLTELFGIGPILAAKLLGEVGDVRRFPTKHHFAAHTGTAPIEASSGEVVRHRLSRAGNRRLNHALYLAAIVQIRHPTNGQAYYRRKLAEGKSRKEALRASNAGCPTPSTASSWPTSTGPLMASLDYRGAFFRPPPAGSNGQASTGHACRRIRPEPSNETGGLGAVTDDVAACLLEKQARALE